MNSYTLVDENNWKRREHCAIFRHYVEPSYCLTTDIDVTNFLGTVRDEGYSFTLSFIWLVSKCANEIEEFRYRFLSEKVVLFDRIDTLFAYMDEGDDLFKMVCDGGGGDREVPEGVFPGTSGDRRVPVRTDPLGSIQPHLPHQPGAQEQRYPDVRLGEVHRKERTHHHAVLGAGPSLVRGRDTRRKTDRECAERVLR